MPILHIFMKSPYSCVWLVEVPSTFKATTVSLFPSGGWLVEIPSTIKQPLSLYFLPVVGL